MAIPIIFNSINVNSLSNSQVAIGENSQPEWDSYSKSNQGSGGGTGINWEVGVSNIIFDCDVIDTPITDPDYTPAF